MKSTRALARKASYATLLAIAAPASAHSWIEYAFKIAPNGTMIGDTGYARGYIPRNSTDPVYSDDIPEWLLPLSGQSAYSGDETLNKYKFDANPTYPMLEAAPGDYVALMHLENGHTTLPENQPNKPRNRGTIYFYGTAQPKDEEKLFDVHLLWNKDSTGGDKRGQLLGTRNYDDGQCYQPNNSPLNLQRASTLSTDGAVATEELACQSDLKLPDDLEDGSTYTIYWYWDWPDLNADAIDMAATKNGLYPWAGTFMRGDKDPNGFTMDAIAKNESYSSVIDIKIKSTGDDAAGAFAAKGEVSQDWVSKQDVYSMAIKDQMASNFQVEVKDDGSSSDDGDADSSSAAATSTADPTQDGGAATVTVTKTVPPTTLIKTVYKTIPVDSSTVADDSPSSTVMVTKTIHVPAAASSTEDTDAASSTLMVTKTIHVPANPSASSEETSQDSTSTSSSGRPDITPFMRRHRPSSRDKH